MKEAVYTVDDSWGGPVAGFADFRGKPHHYQREFDHDADEYSDIFSLTSVADDVLPLVKERQQIWLRWRSAFYSKETTLETHPALPPERPRYQELDQAIRREIAAKQPMALLVRGVFHPRENSVEWIDLPDEIERACTQDG